MNFLGGIPLRNNLLISICILLDDLDVSSFKFLAVCYVYFADLDFCQRIFDQQDSVLGYCSCGCYLAFLIKVLAIYIISRSVPVKSYFSRKNLKLNLSIGFQNIVGAVLTDQSFNLCGVLSG